MKHVHPNSRILSWQDLKFTVCLCPRVKTLIWRTIVIWKCLLESLTPKRRSLLTLLISIFTIKSSCMQHFGILSWNKSTSLLFEVNPINTSAILSVAYFLLYCLYYLIICTIKHGREPVRQSWVTTQQKCMLSYCTSSHHF